MKEFTKELTMHEIISLSNCSELVGKEKSIVSLWLISVDMHRVVKELCLKGLQRELLHSPGSLNFSRLLPLPRVGVSLPRPTRGKGTRRLKFRLFSGQIMANEQVKVQSRYDSFSLVTGSARKLHTFSPTMDLMRQVKHNLEQTAFHN